MGGDPRGVVEWGMARRLPGGYVLDPADPRSPSEEAWAAMTAAERAKVVAMLPAEVPKSEAIRDAEARIAEPERRLREVEAENERLRSAKG